MDTDESTNQSLEKESMEPHAGDEDDSSSSSFSNIQSSLWGDMMADCKPDQTEAEELQSNFESQCKKAATVLAEADVLFLVTGAGFSADSGLAVYADVAKVAAYSARGLDYCDICIPDWLEMEPELFYGFWGQCFNDYRKTRPHEGYSIISKWRDDKNSRTGEGRAVAEGTQQNSSVSDEIRARVSRKIELRRPFDEEMVAENTAYEVPHDYPAGAFFSFTSNVDAHFLDTFEAYEVHECHGNIELWQCSSHGCPSGIWRAPFDHTFFVDHKTMLAPPLQDFSDGADTNKSSKHTEEHASTSTPRKIQNTVVPHIGQTAGEGERRNLLKFMPPSDNTNGVWSSPVTTTDDEEQQENETNSIANWPTCGHCAGPARPAILMFGDFNWKPDFAQAKRWTLWKEALLDVCSKRRDNNPVKLCIMEIGCGLNVPTCRFTSESLVLAIQESGGSATLVRVNPDHPFTSDPDVKNNVVPIMSRGLRAIKQIDESYRSAMK